MNLLGMMQNFGRGGHRGRGRGRGRWLKWILMFYTFLSFTFNVFENWLVWKTISLHNGYLKRCIEQMKFYTKYKSTFIT